MENQQQQTQTTLCRGGCGFYGSPATEGLCSQCFKDSIKRKQDTGARLSPNQSASATAVDATTTTTTVAASTSTSVIVGEKSTPVVATPGSDTVKQSEVSGTSIQSAMGVASSPVMIPVPPMGFDDSMACLSSSSSTASFEHQPGSESGTPPTKKLNRCQVCKKRVGLTGFNCRCGGLYCGEHRYDQAHNCNFDYKTLGQEEIRKNNPVVVSDKIQRI